MKLTDTNVIKGLMKSHKINFQKRYGQNFLIDDEIPERIADTVHGNVLEIGAGIGTLTYELCRRCDHVTAVEIDNTLMPVLYETLAEFNNLDLINADILTLNLSDIIKGEFSVAANLPYYITTPIIMYLLESDTKPLSITVMVQKEVANRLCAEVGGNECGAITASLAWYGKAEQLFDVSPDSFMPPPSVDSVVMKITPHTVPPVNVADRKTLRRVIRGAFAQRRKTLANSLASEFSNIGKDKLSKFIADCGINPTIRGERLSLNEMAQLSDLIYLSGKIVK